MNERYLIHQVDGQRTVVDWEGKMRFKSSMFVGVFAAASPALAQQAVPQPAADAEAEASAEEILVVAQRRAENLQDVPISIAAFSEQTLVDANVSQIEDLETLAPNFTAKRGPQVANFRLNVRGIGAFANNAVEPSVAAFIDGVYVPRPGTLVGNFLDIEGVEVLRGPQGTLFGRNASVGALSLRTAAPEREFSARVSGEYGTGDRYRLDGHVNVPVGDNAAIRVAALGQWFDGYWVNRLDGQRFGGTDDFAIRGSFLLDLDRVRWTVRADYSRSTGDGYGNVDFVAASVTPAQLTALQTRIGGMLPDTNLEDNLANQFLRLDLDDRQAGVWSTLALDVGSVEIRLINSYRDWDNSQLDGDTLFLPVPFSSRQSAYGSQSHNHELQFISPTGQWLGGRLDLVAGLYYFQEDYQVDEQLNLEAQFCNVLFAAPTAAAMAQRSSCNSFLATGGGPNASDQQFEQSTESIAAYAQGTIRLLDPLSLTLGIRYTRDEKTGRYDQTIATSFAAPFRAPERLTLPDIDEDQFTYRISLNYRPNDDILLFANYSTGYKSGGYNSGGGSPAQTLVDAAGNPILDANGNVQTRRVFDRETVHNYELGARTSWLNDRLRANFTAFRMDIDGFQDRAFDGVSFSFRNAGQLRQQGVEFDALIRPSRNVSFTAALAYLDSAFTDYPNGAGLPGFPALIGTTANPAATQDLRGLANAYSPRWSGSFGAEIGGEFGTSGLAWRLNSNVSFTSDHSIGGTTDGNPQTVQDGYALLGARATIEARDGQWSFSVFGTNLTDASYCQAAIYQPLGAQLGLNNQVFTGQTGLIAAGVTGTGSTAVRCFRSDPRAYGASFTMRF
jgi:iron complex outermembrane recepter protein